MLGFNVKYEGPVPGSVNLRQRTFNRIKKGAWEATAEYWHKHFRAKHFTKAGAREYGYAPRKSKRRRKPPLVKSGESQLRTRRKDIRATFKRVRIVMHAPTLLMQSPNSKIDMVEEMTTISAAEEKKLVSVFNAWIERRLRKIKTVTTKRI